MKIFNTENSQEKVYVQIKDLKALMYKKHVPKEISSISTKNKRENEFVEFTEPQEIDFFRDQDWILDYKAVRTLSTDQLLEIALAENADLEELQQTITTLNCEGNNEKAFSLTPKARLLENKMSDYNNLYLLRQGYNVIPFPEVIDSEGKTKPIENDSFCCPLKAYYSINPNSIIVIKEDKTAFTPQDDISENVEADLANTLISEHTEEISNAGNFYIDTEINEEQTQYIMRIVTITTPKKEIIFPLSDEKPKAKHHLFAKISS